MGTPSAFACFFEKQGFILQEWEKVQTDTLSIVNASVGTGALPRNYRSMGDSS